MIRFILHHPWAFFTLLGATVSAIAGVVVLAALLLSTPHEPEDPRAAALRSLREMHPGPRPVP